MLAAGIFALICVYSMELKIGKDFNKEYISLKHTTAVKGIFVFLVFVSHFLQYCSGSDEFAAVDNIMKKYTGQMIVVMFLFYSGYGIVESIKKKGADYVKSFPVQRCLKVLFHFDLALILFYIMGRCYGSQWDLKKILLSLIGWESIGNSNWFIFAIIVLYFIVFISFIIFRKNKLLATILATALTVGYIFLLRGVKEPWWYNTALCLPLGMWYSLGKEKIEAFVMKNNFFFWLTVAVTGAVYVFSFENKSNPAIYIIWSFAFTFMVVLGTMRMNIGNKVLYWLGNHVFSVYILQRIPMRIFSDFEVISSNPYLYFALSLAVTVIISELFDRFTGVLDKKIFKPKKLKA